MAMSPEEIERREFSSSLRGYDKVEVRDFLQRVAREVGRLQSDFNATEWGSPAAPVAAPTTELGDNAAPPVGAPPADTLAPINLDTDDDRFQALGERIAGLLRSAHDSAAQLKESAEAEAAGTIQSAHADSERLRAEALEEVGAIRAQSERELEERHAAAAADADRVRQEAESEATALREEAARIEADARELMAKAEVDARQLREQAFAEGTRELDERRLAIDEQEQSARADREAAMADLADAREQVSGLLEEARTQSDFIRHEAEEIIRSKIRANMDQAERRISVLRNSEVASRERIAAAHKELEGALARLDTEDVPALPENTEELVIEEAHERGQQTGYGALGAGAVTTEPELGAGTPQVPDGFDAGAFVNEPSTLDEPIETFEVDPTEVVGEAETVTPAVDAPSVVDDVVDVAEVEPDPFAAPQAEGADPFSLGTTPDLPEMPPPPASEATVAEAGDSLSALPTRPKNGSAPEAAPVVEPVNPPMVAEAPVEPPASMAEALSTASVFSPDSGPDNESDAVDDGEDALARLVREAMQRAVDSARSSDN